MRRLLLLLLTDTRRHLKSPLALMIYIAIPLFLTGIIGLVFAPRSEESQLPPINILLVDNDKFLASRFLMGAMDSDPVKKMFRVTPTDGNDGERKGRQDEKHSEEEKRGEREMLERRGNGNRI